jgi:hypothetical protein
VNVDISIGRPREEVFDYLADVANHAEFSDHYLTDWHLTREDSYGRGAGARFRVDMPLNRFSWADLTLAEVDPPYRIVEVGRGGKSNRIPLRAVYTLTPGPSGTTHVEYSVETEPERLPDKIMEAIAGRSWFRRKSRRALRRLRSILEDGQDRGERATVARR